MVQIASAAQAAGETGLLAPAAILGAVVAAALIVLRLVEHWLSRDSQDDLVRLGDRIVDAIEESLQPLTQRIARIDGESTRTREIAEKLWSMHDSYDADGRPKWFSPSELERTLRAVSSTCERISDTQMRIIESQQEISQALAGMQELQAEISRALQHSP